VNRLDRAHRDPVFDAQPTATLVLDTDLRIRAVNRAYEAAVQRAGDDLLGASLFEAFPDNPDDADADGVANLSASLDTVARHGRPHDMLVQRYDIADLATGEWIARVWHPFNAPVTEDDRVVGLLHQVRDITPEQFGIRRVLENYRDLLRRSGDAREVAAVLELTDQVAAMLSQQEKLVEEVLNLRQALGSRATIDQAKGIIMADRRCSAEEAFGVLVELSNHTQVKLADVALAFVYRAERSGSDGIGRTA
jgi:PAS domain-containing protein